MLVAKQNRRGVCHQRGSRRPILVFNDKPIIGLWSRTVASGQQELSPSPMERPKSVGEHYRHNQDTRPEGKHMPGLAQIEAADSTDEQVSYGKIEKAPKDIDQ